MRRTQSRVTTLNGVRVIGFAVELATARFSSMSAKWPINLFLRASSEPSITPAGSNGRANGNRRPVRGVLLGHSMDCRTNDGFSLCLWDFAVAGSRSDKTNNFLCNPSLRFAALACRCNVHSVPHVSCNEVAVRQSVRAKDDTEADLGKCQLGKIVLQSFCNKFVAHGASSTDQPAKGRPDWAPLSRAQASRATVAAALEH